MFKTVKDRVARSNPLYDFGLADATNLSIFFSELRCRKGAEIFGEEEPAEYVYQVKSGAVRSYKLLLDGRRQITAFHLIGDIFGLENGGRHRFTTEAVVDTVVRLTKIDSLESAAKCDGLLMRSLIGMTARNLEHAENHMLLLGRKTALERIAAFLSEMDSRIESGTTSLPMTRRDIADYLGLSVETVCRGLADLQKAKVLSIESHNHRAIVIRDLQRLRDFDLQA